MYNVTELCPIDEDGYTFFPERSSTINPYYLIHSNPESIRDSSPEVSSYRERSPNSPVYRERSPDYMDTEYGTEYRDLSPTPEFRDRTPEFRDLSPGFRDQSPVLFRERSASFGFGERSHSARGESSGGFRDRSPNWRDRSRNHFRDHSPTPEYRERDPSPGFRDRYREKKERNGNYSGNRSLFVNSMPVSLRRVDPDLNSFNDSYSNDDSSGYPSHSYSNVKQRGNERDLSPLMYNQDRGFRTNESYHNIYDHNIKNNTLEGFYNPGNVDRVYHSPVHSPINNRYPNSPNYVDEMGNYSRISNNIPTYPRENPRYTIEREIPEILINPTFEEEQYFSQNYDRDNSPQCSSPNDLMMVDESLKRKKGELDIPGDFKLPASKSPIIEALVFCALNEWGIQIVESEMKDCGNARVIFRVLDFEQYYKYSCSICSKQHPTEDISSREKSLRRWFINFPKKKSRKENPNFTLEIKPDLSKKVYDIIEKFKAHNNNMNKKLRRKSSIN